MLPLYFIIYVLPSVTICFMFIDTFANLLLVYFQNCLFVAHVSLFILYCRNNTILLLYIFLAQPNPINKKQDLKLASISNFLLLFFWISYLFKLLQNSNFHICSRPRYFPYLALVNSRTVGDFFLCGVSLLSFNCHNNFTYIIFPPQITIWLL